MKFLCGNCKAKYQIPDEKVVGRTLRMKCRRCNHDILIDGHAMPTASAAPARRPGGSSVSVMPPAPMRSGSGAGPLPARPAPPVPGAPRSKPPPSGLSADFRRHVAAPPAVPARSAPYDLWHVAIQDVPVGPMTRDELSRKIEAGAVNAQSLCWREGMDDWRPMGELAELAALLRRSHVPGAARGSVRPGRVPPAVPGPAGTRPPSLYSFEELEDDGSEPTRIADMTGGHPSVAPPAPGHRAAGASSQPRLPAFAQPAAAPVAAAEPTERARSQRQGMSAPALITLGFSLCIVLLGGPLMVRTFWFTPSTPPAQATAVAPATPKAEDRAARDLEIPTAPVETPDEDSKTDTKPTGKGVAGRNTKPGSATDKPKEGPKDGLSDAERALLARMGGGDTDIAPVGGSTKTGGGTKAPSGPALTANQLMKVVQDNRPALQRCYETALRSSGGKTDEAVKVTVEVVVGMSGTVKSVETKGSGIGNMNDCLRQSVRRWRFPQSGDESPFAFPVVFQPGA